MKIHLDTIGCRLNQSEIETFAMQFIKAGHELVEYPADADITVVNTCDVTAAAAADSRKKIRGVSRAGSEEIVATGCWATLNPETTQTLPGVSYVIPNEDKDKLVMKVLQIPAERFDLEPLVRQSLPGPRQRTRAFIKVQDGCDNRCAFCITTVARGPGISIQPDKILADISAAISGGAHEIVLTGVHLGSWGREFGVGQNLHDLVKIILEETSITRLRLSSLEPWDIEPDFFTLWQDKRLARHLHLPLQSGCKATLKRMARKTTPEGFSELIEAARTQIPNIAITTDIITGFPGETEHEFDESLAFVRQMEFAQGHVFTYSERPGTSAAKMSNQVPHPIRKRRNALMRSVFDESSAQYRTHFLGEVLPVLWETAVPDDSDGWILSGLTDNYLRIHAPATQNIWNQITYVKLTGIRDGGMVGEIVKQ